MEGGRFREGGERRGVWKSWAIAYAGATQGNAILPMLEHTLTPSITLALLGAGDSGEGRAPYCRSGPIPRGRVSAPSPEVLQADPQGSEHTIPLLLGT